MYTLGANIIGTLISGVLTVTGTGTMYDFIEDNPLMGLEISSIIIENGVTTIGKSTFLNCLCSIVTLPDTLTLIDDNAFQNCENLSSIILSNSLEVIGDSAFYGCIALEGINIPPSVTTIKSHAFNACGLKSITLPNSIIIIEESTFQNCASLEVANIPSSVNTINSMAFAFCFVLAEINNLFKENQTVAGNAFLMTGNNVEIKAATAHSVNTNFITAIQSVGYVVEIISGMNVYIIADELKQAQKMFIITDTGLLEVKEINVITSIGLK